jgi:catechol 2,3-dioxygenase-like lactoylglutathione lyase family enzyme
LSHPSIDQQITFLYTHDLETSAHFYEHVLGLPLWLDQGTCRIYSVTASSLVGICLTGAGEAQTAPENLRRPGGVIFTLVTQDVDGWYTYLNAQGVPFEKTPAINERYHIYNCFLRDPNGYLIEIQRFLDSE